MTIYSSTATFFNFHVGYYFGVNITLFIQVNYLKIRSFLRYTAPRMGTFCLLHYVQVCIRIIFVTFTCTIISFVKGWSNDPVPTKLFEINCEGVKATTEFFFSRFDVTEILIYPTLVTIFTLMIHPHFNEWNLLNEMKNTFILIY